MKTRLLLLLLTLVWGTTPARDIDGEYAVLSIGGEPCSQYLGARRDPGADPAAYANWVAGYFSAFNQIVASTYNILGETTPDAVMENLETYCSRYEDKMFIDAVAAVTLQLYANRTNLSPNKDNSDKWRTLVGEFE